jgi:NCAIR mutase (PurE)-related protein
MKKTPEVKDIGFAKLDFARRARTGFGETVFGPGKTPEQMVGIFRAFREKKMPVLATRCTAEQADALAAAGVPVRYDPVARAIASTWGRNKKLKGRVAVLTGGTADIPVAEEAAQSAEFFGATVDRFFDVGVAGLHRLLSQLESIRRADVVIAVAGMEGALASVVGGLVSNPVIAVPTSVGYGANFGGLSAMLTMINSCANGIAVVNIDNGYGAGYMATQINRLACGGVSKNE